MRICRCRVSGLLSLLLSIVIAGEVAAPSTAVGQNPLDLAIPKGSEEAKDETPEQEPPLKKVSVEKWREKAQKRLKEVRARIKDAEANEEEEPTTKQKQQEELLSWLDLTLSQLEDERNKSHELAKYLKTEMEQLDKFLQSDLSTDEDSYIDLDRARDELASERKRLKRAESRVETTNEVLELARQEQRERASARRKTLEAFNTSNDDKKRQDLADTKAEAELMCEIAEATAQLREQEMQNAKASLNVQQAHIEMLSNKVDRLQDVTQFGEEELQQLFDELDKRRIVLELSLERSTKDEWELPLLEQQWLQAKQRLETRQGDKQLLTAEANGYRVSSRLLRESTSLLRKQIELISGFQEIWQRRQRVFEDEVTRKEAAEWTDEVEQTLEVLEGKESAALLDIDDLKSDLEKLEQQLGDNPKDSEVAEALVGQIESYKKLLEKHRQYLAAIREASELQHKLLDELESDSITDSAKDKLLAVWTGVKDIWNLELTNFGENPLTVRKVVLAVLLLLIGIMISRWISRFLGAQVLRRIDIDPSATATIQSLFFYTLLLIFGLLSLKLVNVPLTAFTVLGGAVALGVGFGSQNVINNFLSGLILHAERPVKVGDLIQLDDLYGNVEHIGARSTRVRTGSNLEIIVPNSTFLQNNVINFTLSSDKVRTSVEVGVVYGSPVVTVTQLIRRAVVETGRVSKDPPPIILFKNFGDNALIFEVHFWIRMRTVMDRLQVESAVRYRIEQLFKGDGIVIAFPQRDVHLDTLSPLQVEMVPPNVSDEDNTD